MDWSTFLIIATSIGFREAKFCYFYKKELDWTNFIWNSSAVSVLYKISLKQTYCSYDEVCCGSACCQNPNITYYQYYYSGTYNYDYDTEQYTEMSTGSSLGIAFAIVVIFTFFISCCITCCKQQANEHEEAQQQTRAPICRDVQQVVAYSSDNGTVVIRQPSPPLSQSSSSSNQDNDYQPIPPMNPLLNSSPEGAYEAAAPPYDSTAVAQHTEPPPSYDYVMSHNYPILEESKK